MPHPRPDRRRQFVLLAVLIIPFTVAASVPTGLAVVSYCGLQACEYAEPTPGPPGIALIYWGLAVLLLVAPLAIAAWARPLARLLVALLLAAAVFGAGVTFAEHEHGSKWAPTGAATSNS